MYPVLFSIGPFTLHTYGVFIAAAFLAALVLARQAARTARIPDAFVLDLAGISMLSGVLGARLLYVAQNWDTFARNPVEIFKLWEGGLVFYGGFLVAAGAAVLLTRMQRQSLPHVADLAAPALAIGQAIGRLGCLSAGCCYGKPTDRFCAVHFTHPEALAPLGIGLHPTPLYEAVGCALLGGGLVWLARRRTLPAGALFWIYVLGYGILRFTVEMLRGDVRGGSFAGLYPSQWLALIAVLLSGSVLVMQASTHGDDHA